ncbi:MAG: hypothetical protein H0W65_08895 [Sphingomonas sp.]|uniref:M56 family metallopeptidase n=1 Tax=Sphingomonas sp. TaxID=28214 RepID=UPI0017B03CEF|nr:M56 family metallopeptidase [Sphingomonas sp.]MBA3667825.1 hypothetical protein [Sphingomonas sp.]
MEMLLGLGVKSLLIAAATLLLLHVTRNRSAAERSWIAHLGLFALVALPLASLVLPALHVARPAMLIPSPEIEATAPVGTPTPLSSTAAGSAPYTAIPVATQQISSADWAPYAYAAPVVALLLITMIALLRLFALRARAQVLVDPIWLSALAHAQRRMGFKHGTALLTSCELSSPISWGLMRPVILLNDEALAASDEAEAIIAHELAHVARLDWAKLMLARVATAVFWFNPLAWGLAREAHQLREEAADDAVLAANICDTDYAQLLVGIARHECKGLLLGAHGVAPSKDSLRRRVRRVLDASLARGPAARSWIAGFAAGMLVMSAPLAALTFAPKAQFPEDRLAEARVRQGKALISAVQATEAVGPAVDRAVDQAVSGAVASSVAVAARETSLEAKLADAEDHRRDARIRVAAHATSLEAKLADAENYRRDARIRVAAHSTSLDAILANAENHRGEVRIRSRDPIDAAIKMKVLGITPEYAAAIRASAQRFRNLDTGELMALKVQGVTPEFIRALADAGYNNAGAKEIGKAAILGVTPSYIRAIAASGHRGLTLSELSKMRIYGVGPEDLARPPEPPQPPPGRRHRP